jgi:hypothetical protein
MKTSDVLEEKSKPLPSPGVYKQTSTEEGSGISKSRSTHLMKLIFLHH